MALEEKGMGTRGVQQVHAVLRNGLQSAMRDELVVRNVASLVQVKTPRYEVGRGLSVDQARTLLNASGTVRLHALYVLAVYLGLRRGELLGLLWDSVDLDQEFLQVTHTLQRVEGELRFQPPKTRHSRRTIPSLGLASRPCGVIGSRRAGSGWRRDHDGSTRAWCSQQQSGPRSSPTT